MTLPDMYVTLSHLQPAVVWLQSMGGLGGVGGDGGGGQMNPPGTVVDGLQPGGSGGRGGGLCWLVQQRAGAQQARWVQHVLQAGLPVWSAMAVRSMQLQAVDNTSLPAGTGAEQNRGRDCTQARPSNTAAEAARRRPLMSAVTQAQAR